ncbi:MAG: peptidylprolyl isomerase [Pseudomonadales bacterium]|jgi:peptidyl-prolyl cis-trans isomerase C|nr:peptidylprolyl isomerase [Pseudomonadales bacterium]
MRLSERLRDPVVPFLAIGALCYALFGAGEGETIAVTEAVRAGLVRDHVDRFGREPDAEALAALEERWVAEEILFREALARGLHRGDARTRHRLVDKMRFLLVPEPASPSEDALRAFHAAHADDYRTEWRVSFDARFFATPEQVPPRALERLRAGEDLAGDEYWLGDRFEGYHLSMLRSLFGGAGARVLLAAPEGRWIGPLSSPRGLHFARVTEREAPRPIPFAEARERVEQDWIAAERRRRLDAAVAALRAGYEVRVDG